MLAVLDRGLAAVLATNPIFPETAIRQRMAWPGVADLPVALVTSYETSHFCKPHLEYFLEICTALERKPRECLMVGNDAGDDIAARSLGMRTYLVTDHLINQRRLPPPADHAGSLEDAAAFLDTGAFAALRTEGRGTGRLGAGAWRVPQPYELLAAPGIMGAGPAPHEPRRCLHGQISGGSA